MWLSSRHDEVWSRWRDKACFLVVTSTTRRDKELLLIATSQIIYAEMRGILRNILRKVFKFKF